MAPVDLLGYAAAAAVIGTYSMKTMIPLRVVGIASNFLFIAYGAATAAYPVLVLHLILLPLNCLRLREMLVMVRKVSEATRGNLSLDWLKPFTTSRPCREGEIIFRAGDAAHHLFFIVSGEYRLSEGDIVVGPGTVVGELGFVEPNNTRTMTFECIREGVLLAISYHDVRVLYFQNPQFGFFFLRLVTQRLFRNLDRAQHGMPPELVPGPEVVRTPVQQRASVEAAELELTKVA